MADRAFDRFFNEAQARENAALEAALRAQPQKRTAEDDEADLRAAADPMTVADAIKRILLAWKDRDYFRLLQLPPPEADALGRPEWSASSTDVSRAYRRMSILVHPDKFAAEPAKQKEAREAFEALNEAHRMLRDPGQLEQILAKEADAARARRAKREAEASLDERVVMNAQQKEAARQLKQQEGQSFHSEMQRQMQQRLDAAKRKREALEKARHRNSGDEGEGDGEKEGAAEKQKQPAAQQAEDSDDDEAAAQRRRANAAKRRQCNRM